MSFTSPPTAYVQLSFTTDPNTLADNAVAALQAQWPGWTPDDGDPSVVLIEAVAPMAANAAQLAANMPPAALIAFGTKLLGIPYQAGVSATASATFTVQDTNGPYDIPAGSEIDVGGYAFQTTVDLTIPHGSTTGVVTIASNDQTAAANGLTSTGWVPVNLPVFVTGMSFTGTTSGGVDAQDDTDYLNMVASEMQLRAKSTITLVDFEIVAVNTAGIAKAVAVAQSSHPRNITVFVADSNGNAVASGIKSTLSTTYAGTRMVNAVVTVSDPIYTTVNVTYEALALPGVSGTALQSSINSALDLALSASGWGAPTQTTPGLTWIDHEVVHINKLIGFISAVPGVDYVVSASITASNVAEVSELLSTGGGITSIPAAGFTSTDLGSLSSTLSTGSPITSLPTNALLQPIPSGAIITINDGAGHTQTWTTTAAAALGATSVSVSSQTPSFAFPATTTLLTGPSVAIANTIPNGSTITLTDPTGAHTQTWTTTSTTSPGALSIAVTSQTPNFAYPIGSTISGPITGDLTMNGGNAGALPLAGTMTGTIDIPAT